MVDTEQSTRQMALANTRRKLSDGDCDVDCADVVRNTWMDILISKGDINNGFNLKSINNISYH